MQLMQFGPTFSNIIGRAFPGRAISGSAFSAPHLLHLIMAL